MEMAQEKSAEKKEKEKVPETESKNLKKETNPPETALCK